MNINRRRKLGLGGWKILGSETRVVRKNTSQEEENPIQISGKGLDYLVAISAEPRSREFRVKVTLEIYL